MLTLKPKLKAPEVTEEIVMLKTREASPDGVSTKLFRKGSTYPVPKSLAKTMIALKWAEKATPAPDNKALKGAQENK